MSRHRRRAARRRRHQAAAGVVALTALAAPGAAQAAILQVTTTADDGSAGTLRSVLETANASAEADTITFAPSVTGTIQLAGNISMLSAGGNAGGLGIDGPGADVLTVRGTTDNIVLDVFSQGNGAPAAPVTVEGLTLAGGSVGLASRSDADVTLRDLVVHENGAGSAKYDGGIYADGGTLALDGVTVVDNGGTGVQTDVPTTVEGGLVARNAPSSQTEGRALGIDASGASLALDGATVADNVGTGVAAGVGSLTVADSVVSGNDSENSAGGLSFSGTSADIRTSTFSDNTTTDSGGGLELRGDGPTSTVLVQQVPVDGNRAAQAGGGVFVTGFATTTSRRAAVPGVARIEASTVTDNQAPDAGGIAADGAPVGLDSTVVAGNGSVVPNADLEVVGTGGVFTADASFVQKDTADVPDVGVTTGRKPGLGPLQDNGGPTRTRLPFFGSPLLDAGRRVDGAPFTDQRGLARTIDLPGIGGGDGTDIGAVEAATAPQAPTPTVVTTTTPASPAETTTVPAPTTTTTPPPVTAPIPSRFLLGATVVRKGGKATLTLTVPKAGRLSASGGGIKGMRRTARTAGPATLKVELGKKAARKLRRTGRLKARIKVTFTPADGAAAASARTTILFKKGGSR